MTVDCPGMLMAIMPPQMHISLEELFSVGMLPKRTVGAPTTQGAGVTGGDDQSGLAVADQPAGGRADGVGGDHRHALEHRFVGDQGPWLTEGGGRLGGDHHGVGGGE